MDFVDDFESDDGRIAAACSTLTQPMLRYLIQPDRFTPLGLTDAQVLELLRWLNASKPEFWKPRTDAGGDSGSCCACSKPN